MRLAIIISGGLGLLSFIASVIAAKIGGCETDARGDEWWENERCEMLYYNYFAPLSAIGLIAAVILMLIDSYL